MIINEYIYKPIKYPAKIAEKLFLAISH